jgi:putative sterol carrier protein
MAGIVFGAEWVQACAAAIDASSAYRTAAARWEWPVLLVMRAGAAAGSAQDRHVYLDLHRGECREARLASADDAALAAFVLSGAPAAWHDVLTGAVDPLSAIMRGSITLDKGSMVTLAMHAAAAKALVAAVSEVPTSFPETG